MEEAEKNQLVAFLGDVWKSDMTIAAKCFWTVKVAAWLEAGGERLVVKNITLGVEPIA